MTRRAFYLLATTLCVLGFVWLVQACVQPGGGSPCLFRWLTGLPCPSCGATRALRLLCEGDVRQALWVNPLGLVLAVGLGVIPVWLAADALRRCDTLFRCYLRVEAALHRRTVFAAFVFVMAANWMWNLYKGI